MLVSKNSLRGLDRGFEFSDFKSIYFLKPCITYLLDGRCRLEVIFETSYGVTRGEESVKRSM